MTAPLHAAAHLALETLRVMVVEDDKAFRDIVSHGLASAGFDVQAFGAAEPALISMQATRPHVVLSDLFLGSTTGLEVLARVQQVDPDLPVILMTAQGDIQTAGQAIRSGAYDFLEKPFSPDRMIAVVQHASEQLRLRLENRRLREQLEERSGINMIIRGDTAPLRELRALILRLAPTPVDVLVEGETGTGKELVARCLHDFGKREGAFVAVNCAAVPEPLFESELFGHEAGAYTGARKQRIGRIEQARNGTLFLDEIDAMPLTLQTKVLRALQEREVERLGSHRPIPVNFRIVAATKTNLRTLVKKGSFCLDLFYRLNVASLRVPPLRDRIQDILMLLHTFLQQNALRYNMPVPEVTPEQHQALLSCRWPGNVRELKACADRMILGLPLFADGHQSLSSGSSFDELVAMAERSLLEEALKRHEGSVQAACEELSIAPATMYRKLKAVAGEPSEDKRPLDSER